MRSIVCILGVFKEYVVRVLWLLIVQDPWRVGGAHYMAFKELRAELMQWYKRKRKIKKDPIYEVRELRMSMIGAFLIILVALLKQPRQVRYCISVGT